MTKAVAAARTGSASLHPVTSAEYALVQEIMDNYEYDYGQFEPELNRFQDFQNTYDNKIDESLFPTISKAALPYLHTTVRELMPDTMEYLFPEEVKAVRLTPLDRDTDMEVVENMEWALQYQVLNRMRLRSAVLPTILDSFKAGMGYGAIEPYVYSPPASINKRLVGQGGRVVGSTRVMGVGQPVHSVRYRHIGLGNIIVSKDGNDFNGPYRVSRAYRFDSYDEDEFKRMFENDIDVEDIEFSEGVNADKLIGQARSLGFFSRVPVVEMQHALGGHDMAKRSGNANLKVRVPVLKVYTPTRHTWIANGTTIIYDKESTIETLHTPLFKASSAIDGTRWAPMSDAEASQSISWAQNVWSNLMMDGAVRSVMPQGFYNKEVMDYPPEPSVQGMVGVSGNPQEHVYYPNAPQLNNAHFEFYNILNQLHASATGKRNVSTDPQPGMLRSGIHAFESLMQTMSGRARMGSAILQMNFLEPIFRQALLYMQLFASDEGETYAVREYDQESRKEGLKHLTVTQADLMHGFDLELDLGAKAGGGLNFNERVQEFQTMRDDPYVDPYEVRMNFLGDHRKARRTIFSRAKIAEIEEQRRQQEQQQAEQAAQPQGEPSLMAEQMAQGAGLQQ